MTDPWGEEAEFDGLARGPLEWAADDQTPWDRRFADDLDQHTHDMSDMFEADMATYINDAVVILDEDEDERAD